MVTLIFLVIFGTIFNNAYAFREPKEKILSRTQKGTWFIKFVGKKLKGRRGNFEIRTF